MRTHATCRHTLYSFHDCEGPLQKPIHCPAQDATELLPADKTFSRSYGYDKTGSLLKQFLTKREMNLTRTMPVKPLYQKSN